MLIPKLKRIRSKKHLRFVAEQPCAICRSSEVQVHHIMYAEPSAMGKKTGDNWTVPLCPMHHQQLHANGDERNWWKLYDIDPIKLALDLWMRDE